MPCPLCFITYLSICPLMCFLCFPDEAPERLVPIFRYLVTAMSTLVQIPTEILTLLQIPTELDISKARLGDISRMSPILRRYQQRYPKTCQHKIHDNLRFGEEEDATSRTFLKKIMSKPIFITPLIQSTPRPC